MNTSKKKGRPAARGSTKRSQEPLRRSTRIKGAEQEFESGADDSSQPVNPSKPHAARVLRTPKSRKSKNPILPECQTSIDEPEYSPIALSDEIIPEQATSPRRNRSVVDTAYTPGVESFRTLTSSSIKSDASISFENIPHRPAPSKMRQAILGGGPMLSEYSNPYLSGQSAGVSLSGSQILVGKPPVPPSESQAPRALPNYVYDISNSNIATRRPASVSAFIAAKRLTPQISQEEREAMTSPYEHVSLTSVQRTEDPPYPPVPSSNPPLSTTSPQRSRLVTTPSNPGAPASRLGGNLSKDYHRPRNPETIGRDRRNFLEPQSSDGETATSRLESEDVFVAPFQSRGGTTRNYTSSASIPSSTAKFGQYPRKQNEIPLKNLASRPTSRHRTVGSTTAFRTQRSRPDSRWTTAC